MPAHISHIVFADQVLSRCNLPAWDGEARCLFWFGAQGPDFFYHNGLTRPSGRTFGSLLHRHSYGRLVGALCGAIGSLPAAQAELLRAFTFGWATHAALDRRAHPFIDYFAGWEDPLRPETARFRRCHPFMERIIDVLVLRRRRGQGVAAFVERLDCGERLPPVVISALAEGLRGILPDWQMVRNAEERIENAYRDARSFYRFTGNPAQRTRAASLDREGPDRRRLALFHPADLPPDVDFLNDGRREWRHPCSGERLTASFDDLFDEAAADAVKALKAVAAAAQSRVIGPAVEAVGNQSLNCAGVGNPRVHCAPLALPELLQQQYEAL